MVKPIFKKGEYDNFTNYRPISLLSTFSKLLEKVAANQMMKYINKYKLLFEHQYGFRAGHNTTQPIMHFLDKIFGALFLGGYLKCFLQNLKEGLKKILEGTYFSGSEHQFRRVLLSC